ncbi:MAG: hypothetical protein B7Z66_14465 [Chromatiales bacterium 21-64-14]|nr:MAG: hypothetical protein B7Z66_14465 [Chromatiales bacterium 21-64-14]
MALDEREKERGVLRVLIALGTLTLLAAFLVVPYGWVKAFNTRQNTMIRHELGAGAQAHLVATANREFSEWFIKPGLMSASYRNLRGMENKVATFWLTVWLEIERWWMVMIWLPLMIPVAIGAAVDGWTQRRISQWRFEFISRARHHYARKSVHYFVFFGFVMPFLPIPLPPLFIPMLWVAAIGAMRTWIASLQKRY